MEEDRITSQHSPTSMKSLNMVQIIGNATRDAELKALNNGGSVCTFSLATNKEWKDKETGEKRSEVEYHNCVAWRQLGEICAKYIRKGTPVYIRGFLKTRQWDDKESGKKMYRTEIVVDDMNLLGGKRDDNDGTNQDRGVNAFDENQDMPAAGTAKRQETDPALDPNNLPFA